MKCCNAGTNDINKSLPICFCHITLYCNFQPCQTMINAQIFILRFMASYILGNVICDQVTKIKNKTLLHAYSGH